MEFLALYLLAGLGMALMTFRWVEDEKRAGRPNAEYVFSSRSASLLFLVSVGPLLVLMLVLMFIWSWPFFFERAAGRTLKSP
ncbi:hypothetical protein HY633_05460 [Candidatus Uhrbacteria bacterium]|nr:hypothetical protein [Candidatus Uhrbacteria bacterium]